MTSVLQDLRFGLRALAKHRAYAAVAILTLGLGVGANAAIFSVLRAVVLRDLPYHDADRIAVMWTKNIRQNLPDGSSYLNFRDWKDQSKAFQADGRVPPAGVHARHADGRPGRRAHSRRAGRTGLLRAAGRRARRSAGRSTPPTSRNPPGRSSSATASGASVSAAIAASSAGRFSSTSDVEVDRRDAARVRAADGGRAAVAAARVRRTEWLNERSRGRDALVVLGRLAGPPRSAAARAELDAHCRAAARAVSRDERRLGVTTDPLTDRVDRPDDGAVALDAVRLGRLRAADCLRERGESRARPRVRAPRTSSRCGRRSARARRGWRGRR